MAGEQGEPRRWGCLKVTCGGCICIVVFSVFAAVIVWNLLNQWEPGKSAWAHLPPSTVLAVEGHGLNELLSHVLDDPGAMSVFDRLATVLDGDEAALIGAEYHTYGDIIRSIRQFYKRFSFLHRAAAPNIALVGAGGGGRDPFVIVRPPTWMRWLSPAVEGEMQVHRDGDSFSMSIDGWLVMSASRDLLQEIADNWRAAPKPFGDSPGTTRAYIAFAYREAREKTRPEPPSAGSGGIMFADPFAGADVPPLPAESDGLVMRGLVLPMRNGWSVDGAAGKVELFGEAIAWEAGDADPGVSLPEGHDFALLIAPSPDEWRTASAPIAEAARRGAAADSVAAERLFWMWLWDSWLSGVSGEFVLYGDPPAVPAVEGVTPLPVFSIGWRYPDGVDADRAGAEFGRSLALFLDAATAPGGDPWLQAAKGALGHREWPGGRGRKGEVTAPAVFVNGARPTWLFPAASHPAAGWLATDPGGLSDAVVAPAVWAAANGPGKSGSAASLRWNGSDAFRSALFAVMRERLPAIARGRFAGIDIPGGCAAVENVLGCYPEAAVDMRREEDGVVRFSVRIPFGKPHRWMEH